jgi:hypothetical protein
MLDELKKRIEQKFGEEVVSAKNCQSLSELITERCGARISDSTLRRLWGLLPSPRKPSGSTLDLLSLFVGYRSWADFCCDFEKQHALGSLQEDSALSIWNSGKENADRVSLNTASFIFKKSGVEPNDVIFRQCIDDHISALLDSNLMATGIIAPGGYGKSLGVASWIMRNMNRKAFRNSIIYFLTGAQIDDSYSHSVPIDRWISSNLFKSSENVFSNPDLFKGKTFLLIIDALDEIDSTLTKSVMFLSKIVDFISKYSSNKSIKIIVTTRSSVWGRCMVQEIVENTNASSFWMGLSHGTFESDTTNLPLLNHRELQEAFNNFINKKAKGRKLLVEQLNFILRETISHPYMLKLFISIYNSSTLKLQNYNDVIDEFISQEIAHAKYADENLDIINFILEKQQYGQNLQPVKKNELKEKYPIHLRKGGNYFAAYEHLLAFSILSEETFENRFKNLVVQVDFSHSNLRDLLITRYIVEANEGITHDLFIKVDKEFAGSDLRIRLINNLYSIAYSENNFDAIKDFYLLPESISKDKEILKFVIHQLRNDKPILSLLAKEYSKSPSAKEFLISTYFDFDCLNTSYYKLLELILESSTTTNERVYGLAGLAISRAQSIDNDNFLAFSEELKNLQIDDSCCGYSILLWAIWKIYYAHILDAEDRIKNLYADLLSAEKFYCQSASNNPLATFVFYLELIPHLFLFKNIKMAKEVIELVNDHSWYGEMRKDAKLSMLYDLYKLDLLSLENRQVKLTPMQAYSLEQQINTFSMSQSYFNRVSGYVLLACSYLQQDDKKKFMYYFQTALEICSAANFKLLEISKLKRLADILDDFKMHYQAQKFREYSNTIVSKRYENLYNIV